MKNNPDSKSSSDLLVISSYPPPYSTHNKYIVGVASYAKNTLLSLEKIFSQKKFQTNIYVLAEELPDCPLSYSEGTIQVERVWKRNSFSGYLALINKIIFDYKSVKTTLIEFELSMFGGILSLAFFPVFLLLLRIFGKKIVIVCHQVVSDMNELSGHINASKHSFQVQFLSLSAQLFYRCLILIASRIIVFDEFLKKELSEFGKEEKIIVIPHGVERFTHIPSVKDARKKLKIKTDRFVVLYFGFIAWYKGIDWLLDQFQTNTLGKDNIQLFIAGGPNPNHLSKKFYRDYIEGVEKQALEKNSTVTGFVEEKDIPLYFQAADVVIFPYRTFMSASGPLSMAFSFEKPFLLSQPLEKIFDTSDLGELIDKENLPLQDLTFSFEKPLIDVLKKLQSHSSLIHNISHFSQLVKNKRDWDIIGQRYFDELYS